MALPKRRRPFGGFWDIEDEFERMREEMERMIEDMFSMNLNEEDLEKLAKDQNSRVYGFSMRIGPDGKPIIREFGNFKPGASPMEQPQEREPLVDVIEKDDNVTVIAEVPGVEKEEINLTTSEETLSIKVTNPERKYSRVVKLPAKIKPESATASYKNGVLEVVLEKVEKGKKGEKGKPIPIK